MSRSSNSEGCSGLPAPASCFRLGTLRRHHLAGGATGTCFQPHVPLVPLLLPVCHGAVPQIPEPTVRGAWAAFPDRPVESEDLSDYPRELLAIAHKISPSPERCATKASKFR